jgi:hypothetical protein
MDAFGFSHVIPVLPINFSLIANNEVHLTILDSKKETEFSDELLKPVPYAGTASNGVPTGCIMYALCCLNLLRMDGSCVKGKI